MKWPTVDAVDPPLEGRLETVGLCFKRSKSMTLDYQQEPQWLELKAKIEQTVQLEPFSIILGNREFQWYKVTNPDDLLIAALESQRPEEEVDPFWAATWRAARGLDRFLDQWDLIGRRVLELGCGSGQAGAGAAARGACVLMTDAVQIALEVSQLNAWPVRNQVRFQVLKWADGSLAEEPFPLIIGSDLVYDPKLFESLERCARKHIAAEGCLLLSEPHRHTGDRFAQFIVQAGWDMTTHDISLEEDRVPIRIFECRPLK
jgi:predicted nicotinamide N-methyase